MDVRITMSLVGKIPANTREELDSILELKRELDNGSPEQKEDARDYFTEWFDKWTLPGEPDWHGDQIILSVEIL